MPHTFSPLATRYSLLPTRFSLATGNQQLAILLRLVVTTWLLLPVTALADCYPFTSAPEHLGEIACIKGKVVNVVVGPTGLHFLNFCEDYTTCPFTVVVFPRDLRDVGDVRALQGKEIEVNGKIRSYKGQLEIILRTNSQLRGEAASIPNLPKGYDVERKGSFSAGTFKGPKSSTTTTKKKGRNEPTFPDD